jgi:hypothetical protein
MTNQELLAYEREHHGDPYRAHLLGRGGREDTDGKPTPKVALTRFGHRTGSGGGVRCTGNQQPHQSRQPGENALHGQ